MFLSLLSSQFSCEHSHNVIIESFSCRYYNEGFPALTWPPAASLHPHYYFKENSTFTVNMSGDK